MIWPNSPRLKKLATWLLIGALPTETELRDFDSRLRAARALPEEILNLIELTRAAHPMDVLRTAVSALGFVDTGDADARSANAILQDGVRLLATVPVIVAAHSRIRKGLDAVEPNEEMGHAENFLYMLFGETPEPEDAKLMDRDMILHAEHGVSASTFAARVAASTGADLYSAFTAAVATLKGPLHGGAAEGVMKMAIDIGSEENVEGYVRELLAGGGRVMGMGHPVYKTLDPRSLYLKKGAEALAERRSEPRWFKILQRVVEIMEPYSRRGICPNVDFWAGAVYYLLGIPEDMFVSIFAIGRVPGITLHVMEQYENNIVIRPSLIYDGSMDMAYTNC